MKKSKPKKAKKSPQKATDERDITELMLRDHKPLKRLIKIMKEPDKEIATLRKAFNEFAPLLKAHAHPEEESLYTHMENDEHSEVRVQGFEGFTEHGIADDLALRIPELDDDDDWKVQVKILAELVEHHIEEEEEEMIPTLRKELGLSERVEIGLDYLSRREEFGLEEDAAA